MIATSKQVQRHVQVYKRRKSKVFSCGRNHYLKQRLFGFGRTRSGALPPGVLGRYLHVMGYRKLIRHGFSSFSDDVSKVTWIWH